MKIKKVIYSNDEKKHNNSFEKEINYLRIISHLIFLIPDLQLCLLILLSNPIC